jgi:hypothetical protein
MSDEQTMKDHIEDLMLEVASLRKELFKAKQIGGGWRRAAVGAFTMTGGCMTGCRGACMCTCGYEHYRAAIAQEQQENQ